MTWNNTGGVEVYLSLNRTFSDDGEATILVRRVRDPLTTIEFTLDEWRNFVTSVKEGWFDL